jgi:hypothetical protein
VRLAGATLAAVLALSAAGETRAQSEEPAPTSHARKSAADFAKCVIRGEKERWLARLDKPFGSAQSLAALSEAVTHEQSCVNFGVAKLRFPPVLLRGLVFEALYVSDFGRLPTVESFEGAAPISYPFADEQYLEPAIQYRVMMTLGDCVVRHSPAAARAMILTRVETANEKAAIDPLRLALASCIEQGVQLKLTRTTVRAALAEPLYRLTKAPRTAAPAKVAE